MPKNKDSEDKILNEIKPTDETKTEVLSENKDGEDKILNEIKPTDETKTEQKQVFGILISRSDEPITIEYDNNNIRVSPRARINKIEKNKLPKHLPKGLYFSEIGG